MNKNFLGNCFMTELKTYKTCKKCFVTYSGDTHVCESAADGTRRKRGLVMWCLGGIFAVILVASILSPSPPKGASIRQDHMGAKAYCDQFVRKKLRAPRTAKFAAYRDSSVEFVSGGRYKVVSYVDSQNGFGAFIRSAYFCEIEDGQGVWYLHDLIIYDN